MRRSITVSLAVLPFVLGPVATAGASTNVVTDRGGGSSSSPDDDKKAAVETCPQDQWTLPLKVEGLACILLLPKSSSGEGEGDGEGGGGGPLGGLGGGLFG